MSAAKENWYALDVDVEPQAREAVEYALIEAGAAGTTTDDTDGTRISGYFEKVPDRERVRAELFEALRIYELPSSSVRDMNVREVVQRDWLEEWKKSWQPVEVGRFIIAPPWSTLENTHDRLVIRIEPGMAFGTGTHETTRLCLAAIERYFEGGSFLDVGTGTGILAIAAAMLAPGAHIAACDTDADAIEIARTNAVANGVADRIDFRVGSTAEVSSADLVCANLTADVIMSVLPGLVALTCGRLVLGGILETQIEAIIDGLARLAISEVEITQEGEWVAIVV
ncbi:MAG TPA: 50S ribosomal protein L11 methyltransferase [Pyrinomonadaceae bacterium]|jgi:ribosomal protein L11 methyltransferase